MLIETGVDIVEVAALKNIYEKIKNRTFTEHESLYCESKINLYEHLAARVAAKEAAMKALAFGWNKKIQWKNIEVRNDKYGKPYLKLSGAALMHFQMMGFDSITMSLTHCSAFAIAIVIFFKTE